MARAVDIAEKVLDSLAEVFEAAWLVVGRRGHSLDQEEEEQLRCDLASQIARLAAGGITDSRELVRRSILRFVH